MSLGKTNLCFCLKEPKMTRGYFFILQDTVKGNRPEIKRAAVTELITVEIALKKKKKKS